MSATRSHHRAAFAGLLAMAAALGIGRFVFTPILPTMGQALNLGKADAGWIASANYVGYFVGALLAAHPGLADKFRSILGLALVFSGFSTLSMGLVSTLPAFLALRFIGGVASAFVLVCAAAIVLRHLAEAERESLSAVHFAGVGIGVAGSAILVSVALAHGVGWRGLWIGSGLLALMFARGAMLLLPPSSPRRASAGAAADTPAPSGAGFVALAWAYGLFGFGYVITATFLVTLTREAPAARVMEPYVWLVVGLFAIPSVAPWDWIAARLGAGRAFALACLIEAVGVALSVLEPNAWGAGLAAALLGATYMGITALGLQEARRLTAQPQKALALMTAGFSLGQILGPIFAGQVAQHTGSLTLPSLIAAGTLAAAAALTGVRR
jgi:predicted MFS family arabinose efflux permease